MTNDEKKKQDDPGSRTPWYGRPMGERKPSEEEKVTSGDVIKVDEKGEVRIPGQDPPFTPDEQPEQPKVAEAPKMRVVRVIEMAGTPDQITRMLGKSWLKPGQPKPTGRTGELVTLTETHRQYLDEGDYVVTTVRNRAKDG